VNYPHLLPAIRHLYSRLPETYHLQPWELQWMLYALGYTDDPLEAEEEIAQAVEVARKDGPQWWRLEEERPAAA
jgi:hypothetical protein